ncbi:tetratricopeptide repeat protein [Methanosarcina barkeri]|uniref:TPR repeat-containing protein n=1 Tax=Methanosarcina barkeri CM1 TaxID=796385 RepID=A0A0G3C991_METBA|nr:tetratricopeptide repeat protein [Methanosarcina barkeri]AKJ38581.1 TPR repeat-containing protein [Methanosarcina barkeri CM1]
MSIGPRPYNIKYRIFVDRETCTQKFEEFIRISDNKKYNALFYYGIAGIGKSKLQRKLQNVLNEEYPEILWVSADLRNPSYRNVSTFLVALRDEIEKKCNAKFYLFNMAHAIFWKKSHPDIPIPKKTYPLIKEDSFFNSVINVLNETKPGPLGLIPVKLIFDIINKAPDSIRRFFEEQAISIDELASMEAYEIEKRLPGIFADDFTSNLGMNSRACIFIDTYEALWEGLRGKGSFHEKDKWIRECLIPNMKGVSWVMCGREKLLWAEECDEDWKNYITEFRVEDLPEKYSEEFLKDCGIEDKDIRSAIVKASEGVPYYLNLSVDTYEQACRSKKPEVKDFADTKKKVFDTFVKYLDKYEIRALNILSVPNSWDLNLFQRLMEKFNKNYSPDEFTELIKYSFIKEDTDDNFSLHQLMRKSLQEHQDPTYRKEIHLFLNNYYSNKIEGLDFKSITQEHEIALIEAYYHAKEALNFEDLGGWVVKYTEPFNKAGYWKTIYPMIEDFVEMLKREFGPDNIYYGIFMKNLAYLNEDLGRYNEAISYYQQVLEIYEKNMGKRILENNALVVDDHAIAMVTSDLANSYMAIDEYEKALTLQKNALKLVQNKVGEDPLYIALIQQNMAMSYQYLGQYDEALELGQEALNAREALLGEDDLEVAITAGNVAVIHQQLGNYEEAFALAQRAFNINEKKLGPKHPVVAQNLSTLGALCTQMDNLENGVKYCQRAVEIAEERLEENHIIIAETLVNLGSSYQYIRRYDDALEAYQRALHITEYNLGSENSKLATLLNNIADTYRMMDNYEKALEFYQRALNIARSCLGKEQPMVALIMNNMGKLYIDTHEWEKAHSVCQQAFDIRKKTLGTDHVDFAISSLDLGIIYGCLGRRDHALTLSEHSLYIFEQKLGSDHRYTKQAKLVVDTLKEI